MPGFYQKNEYDLAGFSVGIVDNGKIVDGSEISVGNQIIGIASSGVHSNGYSMARKICFDMLRHKVEDYIPEFGKTLGEELLTPTIIYSETIQSLMKVGPVLGLAHITGGGIPDNLVRVLPRACSALIKKGSWPVQPVFEFLKKGGNLEEFEMMRTFNNGIGMIAVVSQELVPDMLLRLRAMNETGWVIGEIVERKDSGSQIEWA
jgi:phosphoribosylformylglycinamidine cyclo-ligase